VDAKLGQLENRTNPG